MDEIYGFSKIEYLVTFHSIIFGYIASVFLDGWGYLLRRRKLVKMDRYLLTFTYVIFILMLIHWWHLYDRAESIGQNLGNFLTVLPYSLLFYFIGTISFARMDSSDYKRLSNVYFDNRLKLYGCLLLFISYDFAVTIHLENHLFQVLGLLLCAGALATPDRRVHQLLLTLSMISVVVIIFRNLLNPNHHFIYDASKYSKVEHLTIFISMIYGYVITVFFVGWSKMLKTRKNDLSLTQFLWSVFAFFFLIDIWWGSWSRNSHVASSMLHFLLSVGTPLLIFVICILLFPGKEERRDYLSHFLENKSKIFSAFALLFLTQIILSFFFLEDDQWENYMRLVGIVLALISARIINVTYHRILVSVAFLLLCWNLYRQFVIN